MDNEKKLFLPHVTHHHSSAVIENARTLCRKFAMMHELLPVLSNLDGKKSLKYFSNLYLECVPIVIAITYYVIQNKLAGKEKIYNNVEKARKILEHLKILHLRYQLISTSPRSAKKPATWYDCSELENYEIVDKLKELIEP